MYEPRWPVALAILAVVVMLAMLPGRIRAAPAWFAYVAGFVVLIPIVAVSLTKAEPRWLQVERTVTFLFISVCLVGTFVNLAQLVEAIVTPSLGIGGLQLLASSIAVWITNVLTFSLLYWQMDRGGPEARVRKVGKKPDWLFPQQGAPAEDVGPGWTASFVDYLFLGYSTATAFSTTDVMPLTSRAKMLMMLQSAVSLATIVIVAARAINVLGS